MKMQIHICTLTTESRCRKHTEVRNLALTRFVGTAQGQPKENAPSTQGSGAGTYPGEQRKGNIVSHPASGAMYPPVRNGEGGGLYFVIRKYITAAVRKEDSRRQNILS